MFIDSATVQKRLDNQSGLQMQIASDPSDAAASDQLEMLYRQQGNTEELLQLFLTRAEDVAEDWERVGFLRKASEVCGQTGDPNSAMLILLTAFELVPGDLEIANELDQMAYATGQWEELLDTYLVAAARTDDLDVAGGLWLRIACAHALVTGDSEALAAALEHVRAVDAAWAQQYLDLVERQAKRAEVVHTLAELCHRIGDFARQKRCLTRCIGMTESREAKANLHSELATAHLNSDDRVAANFHLREVVRLDPRRADAQAALVAMTKEDGDIRGAANLLRSQALVGDDKRSEAAFQAAQLYSDLDENTQCFDLLSVAMHQDPNHLGAAMPLAERYYKDKRWDELEPLLDLLFANKDSLPPGSGSMSVADICSRGGECAQELGNTIKARDFYHNVLVLEPGNLKALEASSVLLLELGELETAFDDACTLCSLEEGKSASVRAITYLRMADIRHRQGRREDALGLVRSAVQLNKKNLDAGRLLATLCEETQDYRGAIDARHALVEHVDVKEQISLLSEIASLRIWKLDDPMGAIKVYEKALEKEPNNRKTLSSLLELFSAAEMWRDAVDVVLQIADLEEEPLRRGKYYDAAGDIIRRRLGDGRAVRCFNMALDCFFIDSENLADSLRAGCMRPFHRIVEFLHEKEDYEELERSYRKMIQRLSKSDPQVVQLWHELGQLYTTKLNRTESAIASYEVLNSLDANSNHKRVLLGLYEQSEDQYEKAIVQRHELIDENPFDAESYNALTDHYMRSGKPDSAWCAIRALVFLGQASEAQKSFYFQNNSTNIRWPRVPLTNEMWGRLRHPGENPLLSNVLTFMSELMVHDCAVDEAGIFARDENTQLHNELRDLVRGVAYAMGMPSIRIAVDLELAADMLFVPTTMGPAFVVGRGLWQAPSLQARVHFAAKALSSARPDVQLRQLASSPTELEGIVMAAMTHVRPDIPVPATLAGQVSHIHKLLRKGLPHDRRMRLAHAVQTMIASGIRHDSVAWWGATDCTAQRVALLLSGDLQIAAEMIRRESAAPDVGIADLLRFSISQYHLELRQNLNLIAC
ncbi:MAG: hypothetical protein JKY56_14570 [Kofleriaceae bacterium]|nr:hypothetical protein [Kofleriaceae bacterium]